MLKKRYFTFFVLAQLLVVPPAFSASSAIAEGSQPWGGMVSNREESLPPAAERGAEARRILDMARRLEARYAGMEFEETPDEKALREYLRRLGETSLGARPPEEFAKERAGTEKSGKISKEAVKDRGDPVKKSRRGQAPVREDMRDGAPTEEELASGKYKAVTTTTADKGLDLRPKDARDAPGAYEGPIPEVDIIEGGSVSDGEWMSKNQREIEEVVQTRRKDTPFRIGKEKLVEVFVYPCNGDSMQLWKDIRANTDARRLLDEGRIVIHVPYETFEDSGPAIAYAWLLDHDRELAYAYLDYVASLPHGSFVAGADMPERLSSWMEENGYPLSGISLATREERAPTVRTVRAANERMRELKAGFGKFPLVFVDGKDSPNYFLAIETRR